MAGSFQQRDKNYREFQKTNPGVSFAEFVARGTIDRIKRGVPQKQLGPNLVKHADWQTAGTAHFEAYRNRFGVPPNARVVDYGCGTLRLGSHFIRYLPPESYFGLDVVPELLQIGKDLAGEDLLREKKPRFGVISDEAAIQAAADFGADFVYSSSVCNHVHPDEAGIYFGNLARLTVKPGALLFFDMVVAEKPVPHRNLAWPLERYLAALEDLEFVVLHTSSRHEEEGQLVTVGTLAFRRT